MKTSYNNNVLSSTLTNLNKSALKITPRGFITKSKMLESIGCVHSIEGHNPTLTLQKFRQ